jgi:hypothetical protein
MIKLTELRYIQFERPGWLNIFKQILNETSEQDLAERYTVEKTV